MSKTEEKKVRNPMYQYMRELRAKSGLPQQEVAEKLDVRQEAVAQWEREAGNPPGLAVIPRLAKIYGVKEEEIMGHRKACSLRIRAARSPDLDFEQGTRPRFFGVPLPCLTTVRDADFVGQILDAIRDHEMKWRAVTENCDTRSFLLKNESKALEPMIPEGAWVAFDPMRRPRSGTVVLVKRVSETGEITLMIRQYLEDSGQKILAGATKDSWPATELRKDDKIIAVAIEAHIVLPR